MINLVINIFQSIFFNVVLTDGVVAQYLPQIFNPGTVRNKSKKNNFRPSATDVMETFLLQVKISLLRTGQGDLKKKENIISHLE